MAIVHTRFSAFPSKHYTTTRPTRPRSTAASGCPGWIGVVLDLRHLIGV